MCLRQRRIWFDLGNFTTITHSIDTGGAAPLSREWSRHTPMNFAQEKRAFLNKMLSAEVVQPSMSPWASALVLIRKRDGSVRWCIDYCKQNNVTKKDVYPLPCIEECLDTLAENTWFSKLDANSAYWQVNLRKEDREKTALIHHQIWAKWVVRMGFGLIHLIHLELLNSIINNWNKNLIFCGDLKSNNPLWGSTNNNKNGENVEHWVTHPYWFRKWRPLVNGPDIINSVSGLYTPMCSGQHYPRLWSFFN